MDAMLGMKRAATASDDHDSENAAVISKKRARRLRQQTNEDRAAADFKKKIEAAARAADADAALSAYQELKVKGLPINPYIYRVVINVCANASNAVELKTDAFEVFEDLKENSDSKARADETVFSALIKICSKSRDFEACEQLLCEMRSHGVEPRLRTFSSLLTAHSEVGNLSKALWTHDEIKKHSIELSEFEYIALFRACIHQQSSTHFAAILKEYMDVVMKPSPAMWEVLKQWFESDAACEQGKKWRCYSEAINEDGTSSVNGDILESIELREVEVSALLEKVEQLVVTDEKRANQWSEFKEWLGVNGPFDIVMDAANVGYFNQNFAGGGFSYRQIQLMVEHYEKQGKKVLIILHKRRTYEDVVPERYHDLLKEWRDRNIMFNCRSGNNDDWYWLYAAIKFGGRTLVVTNDEMRDHHFQMIHTRSLVRWKERHQVHYSIHSEKHVRTEEPPVYSSRPQRIGDTWHFPSSDSAEWLAFQLETTPEE